MKTEPLAKALITELRRDLLQVRPQNDWICLDRWQVQVLYTVPGCQLFAPDGFGYWLSDPGCWVLPYHGASSLAVRRVENLVLATTGHCSPHFNTLQPVMRRGIVCSRCSQPFRQERWPTRTAPERAVCSTCAAAARAGTE